MPEHSHAAWRHDHDFLGQAHASNERRTWLVVGLTAAMMIAEIAAGMAFNSMALLADGWHMATHAGALAIAACAYRFARRHSRDPRFSFGAGKVGDLAGYTNAVILGLAALYIAWESVNRLLAPLPISFGEAMAVAGLGLLVNLASAALLRGHEHGHAHGQDHEHGDEHDHEHDHQHADHNARAAYLHVLADALTSVLAILALLAGAGLGWVWLDPLMGLVGALVIARWSLGLLRDTSRVLLDVQADSDQARRIRDLVEAAGESRVVDLHLWRLGPGHRAAIVSVLTHGQETPESIQSRLAAQDLAHLTVEVRQCPCGNGAQCAMESH